MTLFSIPMGPRDVPFAPQPMSSALLAITNGCVVLRRMGTFIEPVAHSCPLNKPEDAE